MTVTSATSIHNLTKMTAERGHYEESLRLKFHTKNYGDGYFELVAFFDKGLMTEEKRNSIVDHINSLMNEERTPEQIYETVDNEEEFRKKLQEKNTVFLSDS
jgi:hypothetical protein